jgi:hypothetical protein
LQGLQEFLDKEVPQVHWDLQVLQEVEDYKETLDLQVFQVLQGSQV